MGLSSSKAADGSVAPPEKLTVHAEGAAQALRSANVQEAEEALQECLKVLDKRDKEVDLTSSELLALSDALNDAFHVAPNVASNGNFTLAFWSSALVAWLARHGKEKNSRWQTPLLDHLQLYGRLISAAWLEGGLLVQQPMDNNRYVLLLGEIMCQVSEIDLEQRQHWTDLAARCVTSSSSDLWRSGHFVTHVSSILAISRVATAETLQRLALAVLGSCFESESPGLLERVLAFQITWLKDPSNDKSLLTWTRSLNLLQMRPGAGTCLVAFFADRLPSSTSSPLRPLLCAALADAETSAIVKSCIYSSCLDLCGPQYDIAISLASILSELLPWHLVSEPLELERLQRSATCAVLVPRLCMAMGKSAAVLMPQDQVDHLASPLENWANAVSSHPSIKSPHPARRWFTFSVFFAVATVAREADLSKLAPTTILLFLKALSAVDLFREDSQEYRAICMSLVQCGCKTPTFEQSLLDTFCDLDASTDSNREVRLYFWLSVLAMANIKELRHAWPVLFHCLSAFGPLAARAVQIFATLVESEEAPQHMTKVLQCSLDAVDEVGGDEIMSALQRSIDIFMDMAPGDGTSVLQELKNRCESTYQRGDEKKALQFFQLLCLALRKQPTSTVQAMVTQLLPLQQPFRELFAAHVASSFPETTRQRLAGWLLERYPDAAKAYRDLGPAIGEPQPVLRSAL